MNKECKIISLPDFKKARMRKKGPRSVIYQETKLPTTLTTFAQGKSFFIRTYGCQANVRDSETMAGLLIKAGFKAKKRPNDADIILLNTCAVRENAEDKVYGEIGSLKALKMNNPNLIIGICGCMAQQEHTVVIIKEKYPQVDLVFGTHNLHQLLELLNTIITEKVKVIDVKSEQGAVIEVSEVNRFDTKKAFVNITYGCDRFCTYCIVPYTRGQERSRNKKDILAECRKLVEEGYQEITLLGQNVNAYGKDAPEEGDFASLLEAVAKLGISRLRFVTSHPFDFTDNLIAVIAKYPNIMKSIHLPVQSGSDEILRRMGRRYTRAHYLELVKKMREQIPNLMLTTDIIVGFPGETLENFRDTLSLVDQVGYDGAFTFIYSPRKGTPASLIVDDVNSEEKKKRFLELVKHTEKSTAKSSANLIGGTYRVLVDGVSKRNQMRLSGYLENGKLVHFEGDSSLIGKIVKVKIIASKVYSLQGEYVKD
ncbi:MAG: tRNA (N6-isopentenyl adenosine(37)-C2)-methylthiotransferase MiaB [Bacilli bacterium]|jgi:tRNA-2-methylthio-N6-dimethylallyladenosine synthase